MPHANARLTVHGRLLLVRRIREEGWAVAHAAKAMGISRQCAHRWLARYDQYGVAGLGERSSRPRTCPHRTPAQVEQQILDCRRRHRRGQDWIAGELGLAPRTVSRVLRRAGVAYLRCLDPMTGEVIRSSKATATRYERDRPGELVHVDVKKLGKIPDGGGWRAHGREATVAHKHKRVKIGYDYVHSMVDDHCRLAYSEIHDDETAATCAGFLTRAAAYFAGHGITRIERVMTDNAFAYRHGRAFIDAVAPSGRCRSSSNRTGPGRTARSSGSTRLRPGWSPTTLNGATARSADSRPPADCHQPDGRVHLDRRGSNCFKGNPSETVA